MPIFSTLRNAFRAPAPDGARRQFFRRSAGVGAAALGSMMLAPKNAWASAERSDPGGEPVTLYGADGRTVSASQSEGMIGEIRMFGGNFAPRSWALCEGQLLAIAQNQALFSIIGTTYGGDGRTTMALPDLRGRAPIQQGNGPGLPPYTWGQKGGNYETTLQVQNLASHTHNPRVHGGVGTTGSPINNAMGGAAANIYGDAPASAGSMAATTATGSNLPFSNQPPYLALNFIICLFGVFPSRN